MALQIDLSPMQALEIFYDGETLGVDEGVFIKNEKQRNLKLPSLLVKFLSKYGYLNINCGMSQLWLPDKIDQDEAKVDGKLQKVWIIGTCRNSLIALRPEDCTEENPNLLFDDLPEENGDDITLVFNKSDLTLQDYLSLLFAEFPTVCDNSTVCNIPKEIEKSIKELGEENPESNLYDFFISAERPVRYICYDDEKREFMILVLAPDQETMLKFTPCFAIRELENIFTRLFYEQAANCDFAHALKIVEKLIYNLEQVQGMAPELGEKYKLAGRCCWALRRWSEAEHYYKQAEKIYQDVLAETLENVESFYEGLGNFYFDKEDVHKSEQAYAEVDRIGRFAGKKCAYLKGSRLMRQAQILADGNQLKRAVELYDQALEFFRAEPKGCKYELARCQQLRGEAKKKLKNKS